MAKTISVEKMKDWANEVLASKNEDITLEYRAGVCAAIEKILHSSNNYHGFMFIDNNDSEVNTPGYFSRKYF